MKVPLYILGFLLRYGPQHGYCLKDHLKEVADFANIKLPTVYYHLEKMQKKGLTRATQEKEGNRPERWVYTMTDAGRETFQKLIEQALETPYDSEFLLDAALYFSEALNRQQLLQVLKKRISTAEQSLKELEAHKTEALQRLDAIPRLMTEIIFSHHDIHLQAELHWLEKTLEVLQDFSI